MENLLGQLAANQAILVNVYDITNCSNPLTMYGNHSEEADMSLSYESKLDFGDPYRIHQMICRWVLVEFVFCVRSFNVFACKQILISKF